MTNSTEVSTASEAVENPMITVDGFKLKKLSIITTFSDTAKIDKAVAKFAKDALSIIPDLSTVKSRGDIASIAYKISKKKTNITNQMIDPSIEEAKALVKNVNAGKKHFQAEMDKLRDKVRAPLNEWEVAEKIREEKRISDIKNKISGIINLAILPFGKEYDKEYVSEMIEAIDNIDCSTGFEEFAQEALQSKGSAKEALSQCLNTIIQKELKDKADEEFAAKELELKEQQLKAVAQERVNKLMMIPVGLIGKKAIEIKGKISSLKKYEVPESEFGELFETAKVSVINVISQLEMMHQQQVLVEKSQAVEVVKDEFEPKKVAVNLIPRNNVNVTTEKTPVKQQLVEPLNEVPVNVRSKPISHSEMIRRVEFWASEYGVVNSELSDLMNILNQHK